jgi:hypothetical protein
VLHKGAHLRRILVAAAHVVRRRAGVRMSQSQRVSQLVRQDRLCGDRIPEIERAIGA